MDKQKLEKGEIVFLWLMLLVSAVITYFSLQIFLKDTSLSSEGAFPMLISLVMLVMIVLALVEIRNSPHGFNKGTPFLTMAAEQIKMLLPGSTALVILYVLIYAIVLKRVGFIVSTYLFLVITSVTLFPKKIVKTCIISAVMVAAIMLIFQLLFKVRLP